MSEMQAATEPLTDKLINNKESDAAQPKPSERGVVDSKLDLGTLVAADPLTYEITYPGVFLSSVLNAALLLALFLVALDMVSISQHGSAVNCDSKKIIIDNCSHGDSHHYSRVSQRRPGRLVRICLFHDSRHFPSLLGESLQVFPSQDHLHNLHCHL